MDALQWKDSAHRAEERGYTTSPFVLSRSKSESEYQGSHDRAWEFDDITNTDGRFTPGYCLLYLLIREPLLSQFPSKDH